MAAVAVPRDDRGHAALSAVVKIESAEASEKATVGAIVRPLLAEKLRFTAHCRTAFPIQPECEKGIFKSNAPARHPGLVAA